LKYLVLVDYQKSAAAAAGKGGLEGMSFYRVPDRGEVICVGVKLASSGDLVIACGKGHERACALEGPSTPGMTARL